MLESVLADLASPAFRAKAVVTVAGDLNIARRNWSAYPPGHPQIEASLQKLLESFHLLCQDSSALQLGVTRDGLLLGDDFVEKDNRICRNLAGVLFERGVGALSVLQVPSRDELAALLAVLALKREDILARGGIEQLWQEAGIVSLQARAIRYDRFSGTEEELLIQDKYEEEVSGSLWERFVKLLVKGDVGLSGTDVQGNLRPEVLAAALNAHFARRLGVGSGLSANTLRSVTDMLQQAFPAPGGSGGGGRVQLPVQEKIRQAWQEQGGQREMTGLILPITRLK